MSTAPRGRSALPDRVQSPAIDAEQSLTLVRDMRSLLRTADFYRDGLIKVLEASLDFKREPLMHHGLLRGEIVVLYFNKPSTRTRVSFEAAVTRLDGSALSVGPHDLQLGRGETIEDTARVISSYASAFVIRTASDDDVRRFAAAASIPVINALTDRHHPCQSVADLMTLREVWGELDGGRVAFVGDGNNVAHSLIEGCALLGVDIAVATPAGHAPDSEVVERARRIGAGTGAKVLITEDPVEAVRGAGAVYTDVWLSMGVPETEHPARLRQFKPYRVDANLMAKASSDAVFLHCLPAHRGEEVTDEVIDGPRSRVFEQAANRLPTEQAILWALVTGALAPVQAGGR
jgi:ornithine carbamoyltransferase